MTSASTEPATYGDVIPVGTVTDEFGTYAQTAIDPAQIRIEPAVIDSASLSTHEFSADDAAGAAAFALDFVTREGMDSIALDGDETAWERWQSGPAREYISSHQPSVLSPTDAGDRSDVIISRIDDRLPRLIRDGAPRLSSSHSRIDGLRGDVANGAEYIWVTGVTKAAYRVSDVDAVAQLSAVNPTASPDTLRATMPFLTDGVENSFRIDLTWGYAVVREDGKWRIAGYQNTHDSGFDIPPAPAP